MMKIIKYILVFLLFAVPLTAQENIQNAQEFTKQYQFNGQWMPDIDPIKVGAENYKELKNLRYSPRGFGLEGVNGYSKINSTALTTYTSPRVGAQLKTPGRTVESYVLLQSENSGETASQVFQNQTAIPDTGDFESSAIHSDDSTASIGSFSEGPLQSIVYANGAETMIWSGEEHRVAALFGVQTDDYTSSDFLNPIDFTEGANNTLTSTGNTFYLGAVPGAELITNGNMETDANWSSEGTPSSTAQSSTTAHSGTYSWKIVADSAGDGIVSDTYSTVAGTTYYYTAWVYITCADTTIDVTTVEGDGATTNTDNHTGITCETWTKIAGSWVETPGGAAAEIRFLTSAADGSNVGIYIDDVSVYTTSRPYAIVLSERKLQGVKFTVETANTEESVLTGKYWNGAWTAVSSPSDGTTSSDIALAQTGTFSFTSTVSDAKPFYFEGVFLYAYLFNLSWGSAEISSITVDAPFQDLTDAWDGVDRQPIKFVLYRIGDTSLHDYTLEVNEASPLATSSEVLYAAVLDQMNSGAGDYILIGSEDQLTGIYWDIVSNLINAVACTVTIQYWNGLGYTTVGTVTDRTLNDAGTVSLARDGVMSWDPPSLNSEHKKTEDGVYGYFYKITFSDTLTGTYGGDAEVAADIITLIPAQKTIHPFSVASTFKDRVVLCDYKVGNERNRCDYSERFKPNVFNGAESSDDGLQSLYLGNSDPIMGAKEIHNRYGSRVITKFAIYKKNEIYTIEGDTVEDMLNGINKVSENIGLAAPLTLVSVESGYKVAEGEEANVHIFLDSTGPYVFNGERPKPILGVENYFDPQYTECINYDEIERSVATYDPVFKEYNLLIPSGSSQTTNNVWLVYNVELKKWYRKDTDDAEFPQTIFKVQDTDGGNYLYGGIDTGYMMRIENGNTWNDGTAHEIEQIVETGDFLPTGNIMDLTRIRGVKLIAKRIPEAHQVSISHFPNTDDPLGIVGTWSDWSGGKWADWEGGRWVNASMGNASINLSDSLNRVVRKTLKDSLFGWTHRFRFVAKTTATDKGFQPIGWGCYGKVEGRRDDD